MSPTFESLDIRPDFVEALAMRGISEPSPIQREAIPAIFRGSDLIAQSQTGTGKTLAYLLPILQRIDAASKELQAVVLVPTRELGVQIAGEIEKYGGPAGIRGQALIGGAALHRQIERLKLHPHIVVGTPGRIAELIGLRKLKMHRVRTIVVDEADQTFALGSVKEVEAVLKSALRDRQLLFFSATLPAEVRQIARRWMREPVEIEIDPDQRTARGIEHLVFVCEERDKIDTLRRLIRLYNPRTSLAFVGDLDKIAEVASKLRYAGLAAEALYGDAPKKERAALLNRFRAGQIQTLVATDVAARGLDVEGLTHVFHFDLPADADRYVHRAGRTGRMGKSGLSICIATERELSIVRKWEKQLGIEIKRKAMYRGEVVDPPKDRQRLRPNGKARSADGSAEPIAVVHAGRQDNGLPARPGGGKTAASPTSGKESGARSARRGTGNAASSGLPVRKPKNAERERDRKNKGAPRWLKEKWGRTPHPHD